MDLFKTRKWYQCFRFLAIHSINNCINNFYLNSGCLRILRRWVSTCLEWWSGTGCPCGCSSPQPYSSSCSSWPSCSTPRPTHTGSAMPSTTSPPGSRYADFSIRILRIFWKNFYRAPDIFERNKSFYNDSFFFMKDNIWIKMSQQ